MTRRVCVVLGAKTRLGQELTDVVGSAGTLGSLVQIPTSSDPNHVADVASLLNGDEPADRYDIAICALGPVHPDKDPVASDMAAFRRDIDVVAELLARAPQAAVNVVLVSSVIALAAGAGRRYYGGWKSLVEGELVDMLEQHAGPTSLTVLYPGRLVEKSSGLRLHAPYRRVARRITTSWGTSSRQLVGVDARLWLFSRLAVLTLRSILPGRSIT